MGTGRRARSVAMITQRPTMGSLRSSGIGRLRRWVSENVEKEGIIAVSTADRLARSASDGLGLLPARRVAQAVVELLVLAGAAVPRPVLSHAGLHQFRPVVGPAIERQRPPHRVGEGA